MTEGKTKKERLEIDITKLDKSLLENDLKDKFIIQMEIALQKLKKAQDTADKAAADKAAATDRAAAIAGAGVAEVAEVIPNPCDMPGLENKGNTCWMDSVLFCLLALSANRPIREQLLNKKNTPMNCHDIVNELETIYKILITGRLANVNNLQSLMDKTRCDFRKEEGNIAWGKKNRYLQQDAAEFIINFLSELLNKKEENNQLMQIQNFIILKSSIIL